MIIQVKFAEREDKFDELTLGYKKAKTHQNDSVGLQRRENSTTRCYISATFSRPISYYQTRRIKGKVKIIEESSR